MELLKLIKDAKKRVVIVGILPLEEFLVKNHQVLSKKLKSNNDFKIVIFHENENLLFNRSLYLETREAETRLSFQELQDKVSRIQRLGKSYMFRDNEEDYKRYIEDEKKLDVKSLNLWQPIQIIQIDDSIYTCPMLLEVSKLPDYQEITEIESKKEIIKYLKFITEGKGEVYQSIASDEHIEMYDKGGIPRGIFPRKAFYNKDFQRHSVWVFIFNRKGELLIHQRNKNPEKVKDNGGLWDKSAGGHVDVVDRNSFETAERELVEELYMSDAEYTDYVTSDTSDFVNLGEWLPEKREKEQVFNLFRRLGKKDYGYFFLKKPVKRTSKRMFITWDKHGKAEEINQKETKFISDIFLFVAPNGVLMDKSSVDELDSVAAENRKLISIRDLFDDIEDAKADYEKLVSTYTDDLIFIADDYKDTLLQFSEFIKQIFK